MAFHLKRIFIIFATLMVIMQISQGQDDTTTSEAEEDDDSSSEETVYDSNEAAKHKRRSVETSVEGNKDNNGENNSKASPIPGLPELRAIPGLPDPQTILKIAEILTTVGQEVLPILVSGNPDVSEFIANRVSRDRKFLTNFKNEIDILSEKLKKRK